MLLALVMIFLTGTVSDANCRKYMEEGDVETLLYWPVFVKMRFKLLGVRSFRHSSKLYGKSNTFVDFSFSISKITHNT